MREREIKLSAAPTFVMPDLSSLGDDLRVAVEEPHRTQTTYLDTEDLRLARAGASLRLRTGEGWTVKLPGEVSNGVLSRPEYTFATEAAAPPGDARDLTLAYTRTGRLATAARLRTLRRRIVVDDLAGARLFEVDDDEVSVLGDHGRVAARFRELEVEFTDEAPPDLVDATVYLLRTAGAGDPDAESKYLHVLGPRARQAADITIEPLSSRPTAAEVIRLALASGVLAMITHDPVVRRDEDVEGVHQMRVASRKLRSHLRTFRPLVDPDWADGLREELAWVGGSLGATRDADVMLMRLRRRIDSSPNPDAATPLLDTLLAQRADALARLLADIRSDRYLRLLEALVGAQRSPAFTDAALVPADQLLDTIEANREALRKRVRRVGKHPGEDELHRIRVWAKRYRYAAEVVEPVVGKVARSGARAAAALQGVLGERHDAIVFRTWLHDRAVECDDPATAFAAGEFAGEELVGLRRSRNEWRGVWRRLGRVPPPSGWRR
jgi:CHAD domain-containing protein